jgi:hypothetical protein
MWIFLWIVLSAIVLGIFFWNTAILQQQKKAWAAFAKKMNLVYTPGRFTAPPTITGLVKNYKVSFYTDALPTNDARGQRYITAIEIEMGPGMTTTAALATKEYNAFLAPLSMVQIYTPTVEGWNPENIVKTKDSELLARYLTPERLKTIQTLFSMKGAATLLFFDEQEAVLRIQTTDPLRNAERMEKIARRLFSAADILSPAAEEKQKVRQEQKSPENEKKETAVPASVPADIPVPQDSDKTPK